MQILRVAQKLYPETKGGGAYHVHAMSRDQVAMGHDVTVLTLETNHGQPHIEERDRYTILRYPVTASAFGNDISVGVASYLKDADDFDVIHAHSHLYFSTNLAALKRVLGGPPLAITNHGLYSQTASKRVFDIYLRTVGRWTFNRADLVFTYSKAECHELREMGVKSEIAVIPNGIDTDRFHPNGRKSDLIKGDGPIVLFVGRLVEGKRPLDAIRALAKIRHEGINASLFLAGSGPLEPELRSVAKTLGVSEAIQFMGHVPYDEMPAVYRAADVYVLPSRDEGVPRTVLEAKASGLPVVTSDLPQLRNVVSSCDRTFPVNNVDQFAYAISEVLANEYKRPKQINQPQDFSFKWCKTVRDTTNYLKSLMVE